MIYVLRLKDNKLMAKVSNIIEANNYIVNDLHDEIYNYIYLEDMATNVISSVIYVDGVCVYNSKDFWTKDFNEFLEHYNEHEVKDICGRDVVKNRFESELLSNSNRIGKIDEQQGQVAYNIEIGKEFITLFRLECIKTKFTKESNTSPMIIFKKLGEVITMLSAGAFREAKQFLQGYRDVIRDDFLTDARIDKYIAMLDSADAIEYSTDEDYFYTAPEKTEANEFLEE